MTTTEVLVVDDQHLVRAGLAHILETEPDLDVVGQSSDGEAAVLDAARLCPDVVLMDIRMPVLDGIAAARRILAADPRVKVVMLTTFDLDEYVYQALRAGATGFVLKDSPAEEIVRAVRTAAAGDALISASITRRLINEFAQRPVGREDVALGRLIQRLTAREREVLEAMSRGLNNDEVGRALFISEGTVRTHVNHLLAKLGARDRVQAVVLAYESGLVVRGHTAGADDPRNGS